MSQLSGVGTPWPAKEMVGGIGAFKALADASKSGPSGGRPEGGAEAAPESRLGLGGGASLRDRGGVESCNARRRRQRGFDHAAGRVRASCGIRSLRAPAILAGGDSAGSVTPTCVVSSEFSIVIQLSTAIHRSAPCRVYDRRSTPARARLPRSNPGETCRSRRREPRSWQA